MKLRTRGMTADWQVFPRSEWNYALATDQDKAHTLPVEEHPMGGVPFALQGTPVSIRVPARQVPSWRAEDGVANLVPLSPVESSEPEETITLVPYAAAKLRITSFPQLKT